MKTLALVALLIGTVIAHVPRLLANVVGLGYRSRYTMGPRSIERPKHFSSKAHKAAFENVGDYVCNALTRDVMLSFRDRNLRQGSILRPKGVSIEVWHQVLDAFEQAGFIQRRWEMLLPPFDGKYVLGEWSCSTPGWHADGTRITETPVVSSIGGIVPGTRAFDPGLLTAEQKAELLGTRYALACVDDLVYSWHGGNRDKPGEQRYVVLSEDHFKPIYVRHRSILTDKELGEGAERLARVVKGLP